MITVTFHRKLSDIKKRSSTKRNSQIVNLDTLFFHKMYPNIHEKKRNSLHANFASESRENNG